ncbi:LOW QUALITY PROTEIN: pyrimidodiazepine synthase-like [Haliotis rubra]|uniref:LOW QUALITY PROTEIN: pyrimidodiazepine synthase-like n=1 Tax=Haliotis rubra TaxID=36100 RepID=UPI001EE53FE4|nr:LOW QUALITY PROTEIN: pyrimidodiazepine synthase-like [Haliotis rubra]
MLCTRLITGTSKVHTLFTPISQFRSCDNIQVAGARLAKCSSYAMSLKSHSKGSPYPSLSPGTLRIYSMRFCPYAQRTRLVLEHKKIPYETINVDLKKKPDWFLERNPIGLVPVLEKGDQVVYESLVCDDYLDQVYPDIPLYPQDPYQRARDRILSDTSSQVVTSFYKLLSSGGSDEAGENYFKSLRRYEAALGERGEFFGGATPCMVDFTLWPWFERDGVVEKVAPKYAITENNFPNLAAWQKRMYELPAVKATMFDAESHLRFYASFKAGAPDYDFGL